MGDEHLTDQQIRELWQWAAESAHDHLPYVCGHEDGRCKYRRLNLEECDALLDEWLTRHGPPPEPLDLPGAGRATPDLLTRPGAASPATSRGEPDGEPAAVDER